MSARDEIFRALTAPKQRGVHYTADVAEQVLAEHEATVRDEVLAEVVAWLVKKAREYRSTGSQQHALQADAIDVLASKAARGAIRPDNLRTLERQGDGGPEDVPALLAELERTRAALDTARADLADSRDDLTAALGAPDTAEWSELIAMAARAVQTEQQLRARVAELVRQRDRIADNTLRALTAEPEGPSHAEVLRGAAEILRARGQNLAGEYADSSILHEDGPSATVATWKRAGDEMHRLADAVATWKWAGEELRLLADAAAAGKGEQPTPRTVRQRWVDIANALNAAVIAGLPVGIDLDGTLTDHHRWSVVWDSAAERWTIAGYEDDAAEAGEDRG